MKIIPIHTRTAIAVQIYAAKADDDPFSAFGGPNEEVELGAKLLIESLEDHVCIAFLEALILESKKSINRHATVCENNCDDLGIDWDPPEWARKYADVGL